MFLRKEYVKEGWIIEKCVLEKIGELLSHILSLSMYSSVGEC